MGPATQSGIFTDRWARAWAEEINRSEACRRAAGDWESPIVLTMRAGGEESSVYLDLYRGECREARSAGPGDAEAAPYVISATPNVWNRAVDGTLNVTWALVKGEIKVLKGARKELAAHADAWREMIAASRRIEIAPPHRDPA